MPFLSFRVEVGVHGRGDYAICFDNSFSIQTKKTVFFELYLLDEKGNYLNSYDLFADVNKAKAELSMQISDFDVSLYISLNIVIKKLFFLAYNNKSEE